MKREHFGAPAHAPHAREFNGHADGGPGSGEAGERRSIRRERPPPLDAALVPTSDVLRLRLAEELEYARRILESLGDALSVDAAIVVRHSMALQSIDIVGQMLGHIANVTRSSAPERAVERIGMGELKARLKRKGGV